jgi:hypothetical protein
LLNEDEFSKAKTRIKKAVDKALEQRAKFPELWQSGFILNADPRGYSLKVEIDKSVKFTANPYRDWGGYAILAPSL